MTNAINPNSTLYNSGQTGSRVPSNNLGKDEFLQLLVMQLSNQDPMEPMKDTDFIAQMAQFSSLEQMQNLNNSFMSLQTNSLIGKTVIGTTVVTTEDGSTTVKEIVGRVDGVVKSGGKEYLSVGNYLVAVENVSSVFDESDYNNSVLQAQGLVGKYVNAQLPPEKEGGSPVEVSGIVDEIIIKNGQIYAKVGDKEVPIAFITNIKPGDYTPPVEEKPEDDAEDKVEGDDTTTPPAEDTTTRQTRLTDALYQLRNVAGEYVEDYISPDTREQLIAKYRGLFGR